MAENTTNYQCPACTGPLHFDSATGKLVCDYCGSAYEVADIEAQYAAKQKKADSAAEADQKKAAQRKAAAPVWDEMEAASLTSYTCTTCGAELVCDATTAATNCPYCGNPTVLGGKLSGKLHKEGKKVLLAAADTFRAAASEQLTIWAERTGADIVKHAEGADPAAVAFDAVSAAKARGVDVVLIDTAGRLQTKVNLMEELAKISRVIKKVIPDAPHQTLLVLDATTGQNAISQAKNFGEIVPLTGVVLTKLDGTAKGGVVLSVHEELHVPIKWIGLGEREDDLDRFHPDDFAKALFETEDHILGESTKV